MAQLGPMTVTGEGQTEIDPIFHFLDSVQSIETRVIIYPPKARVLGTLSPTGAQHIGAVGIGYSDLDSSGVTDNIMSYYRYIQWSHELVYLPNFQAGAQFWGTLFWRIVPGAEVEVTVYV